MTMGYTNTITDTKHLGNHDDDATLSMETRGGTLFVSGDVDLYVAADFRQAGERYVRSCPAPIIDLIGVPFLDSAGLAALLSIEKAARQCDRSIRVVAAGNPRRVLRITGVERILTVTE